MKTSRQNNPDSLLNVKGNNTQQLFKLNVLSMIDRIKNLEQYVLRVTKIACSPGNAQPSCELIAAVMAEASLEDVTQNNQTLINDLQTIIQLKPNLPKYSSVIEIIGKMIIEFEEISQKYQILHYQNRLIASKISINKEMFNQFKKQYILAQKYFGDYAKCAGNLKDEIVAQRKGGLNKSL